MIHVVEISKRAKSDLAKVPLYIANKLKLWINLVESDGLLAVRQIKGFHDEPLRGNRSGQRSIRLNRAYRAIYEIGTNGSIEFVSVEEVNKHEY